MTKNRLRILFIDDDKRFLEQSKQILEQQYCWVCDVASSGPEGIDLLERKTEFPDVVVVDMSMPEMDGHGVIEYIHSKWSHLCIVVLTGSDSYKDINNALKAVEEGADDYLVKPLGYNALVFKLQIAYEHKRFKEREVEDILTFARGFMHQIGPRLSAATIILDGLEQQIGKKKACDPIVRAKENLKHAQWLIKRFREYPNMIEKGKKVHLVEKVKDALEYVKESQDFTYGDLNDFDISIEGDNNTSLVMGSEDLIEETFANIFDNAFKAMNVGERKLRISIRDTEKNMVEVKVTDSGHGISEENKKRIFEPFFTTREGKGTGLGLYFAKMVIDNHGGKITFESEVGKGTTFIVSLPIASDKDDATPPK